MNFHNLIITIAFFIVMSCTVKQNQLKVTTHMTAEKLLGNPDYHAISYGGYRQKSRDIQPTIAELK